MSASMLGLGTAALQGWMPPSKENWELIVQIFQWGFPIAGSLQWIIKWYGMGKTSVVSRLNVNGRFGWLTMEAPGFLILLYIMRTLPPQLGIQDLPWQNKVLAGLFVIHYSYRALAFPFLQPSISPLHIIVWLAALCFQFFNATGIGGWLAAYGPLTQWDWSQRVPMPQFALGVALFYLGLAANYFHDEELREIRRRVARRNGDAGKKHYQIPQAGLFKYILYPHYVCEWVEWFGFYMACGFDCAPARAFLLSELFVMLPRAVNGRQWYIKTFGEEKLKNKYAVIPGLL